MTNTWKKDNPEKHNAYNKNYTPTYRARRPEWSMWVDARQRAKENNIDFDLELSDVIIPEECPALKVPFKRGTPFAASLDRIDPAKGYVKGNTQVISWKANRMKNNASSEELRNFSSWLNQSTN